MKILIKEDLEDLNQKADKICRDVYNAFDIPAIIKELKLYDIQVNIGVRKRINERLFAVPISCEYIQTANKMENDKLDAMVYLVADCSNLTAMAISRYGANKEKMLLISSIANKHIRVPFGYNSNIRKELV